MSAHGSTQAPARLLPPQVYAPRARKGLNEAVLAWHASARAEVEQRRLRALRANDMGVRGLARPHVTCLN